MGETATDLPALTLKIALRGEEVVVTASKIESTIVNAPATMSVVTADTIATSPAQNYADLLRAVPGVNVIQMSARDINLTSRQATSTLTSSQLTLLDGRSIYLDFFGLVNGCVARGVADPDMVRDFLLFYYLWWRDEIMEPMRKTLRIEADHPKVKPVWWVPLRHLDALAEPRKS